MIKAILHSCMLCPGPACKLAMRSSRGVAHKLLWQLLPHAVACSWLQVIRIQPNESIYLKINNKVPGLGLNLDVTKLDLSYKARYNKHLPDAYERLILDVINGDKRLFIRNDELAAAWDLFTPILKVG